MKDINSLAPGKEHIQPIEPDARNGPGGAPALFNEVEFEQVKALSLVYEWAHRTLMTKLNIISEDLASSGNSPIESIHGRMKSLTSIAGKLAKMGVPLTAENAKIHLRDIGGIRIICHFSQDIHYIISLLRQMPSVKILDEKDYITKPKPSGYRSYHVIMEVPIFYSGKTESIPVEIQLRTQAMNFWASLEHKARYKYQDHVPAHLSDELVAIAEKIDKLDRRMATIHEIITLINQDSDDTPDQE
ncbi:MAG: GTP pyrophosphokinase family protein [Oscillospiraceae bacterium]|nr:GTP pyrophosphokinase family protein [Oscillospiraceae bacterium]